MKSVYLAGPIDYDPNTGQHMDGWRHSPIWEGLPFKFYCPICEATGKDDAAIMAGNWSALLSSAFLIAEFSSIPSFGTPIEVWAYTLQRPDRRSFIVHPGNPGLFIRELRRTGRIATGSTFQEARDWLGSMSQTFLPR